MKLTVVLEIEYDSDTVQDEGQLLSDLSDNIKNAIGNGILTGPNHEVEVDNWNMEIGPL